MKPSSTLLVMITSPILPIWSKTPKLPTKTHLKNTTTPTLQTNNHFTNPKNFNPNNYKRHKIYCMKVSQDDTPKPVQRYLGVRTNNTKRIANTRTNPRRFHPALKFIK